jgi:hypothetical protein
MIYLMCNTRKMGYQGSANSAMHTGYVVLIIALLPYCVCCYGRIRSRDFGISDQFRSGVYVAFLMPYLLSLEHLPNVTTIAMFSYQVDHIRDCEI